MQNTNTNKIRIIPAIDIIGGKCVRLSQGDYAQQKVYNEDPVAVAKEFAAQGVKYLHVVDLDGAKAKRVINYPILEEIARSTALKIDFGGGIKSEEDLKIVLESGAQQVTVGTLAVKKPELFIHWLQKYGADKIILGADARDGKIATNGWQEASTLEIKDFLKNYTEQGVRYTVCTDIAKDGMLNGTSLDLYREIRQAFPELKLIASGGVTEASEVDELQKIGCDGVIIGKAFYEGTIQLPELANYLGN